MTEIWIRANGTPIPQGSKVAGKTKDGRPFVRDANPLALRDWRETVAQATWRSFNNDAWPIDTFTGPVEMIVWLYFEKPKSNKSTHPTSRLVGDLDKHLRAIGDSIVNAGGIDDDSQIVLISGSKNWADEHTRPGAMIYLATIDTSRISDPLTKVLT